MQNHLQSETSPYLLQHKSNPVDWYPWCDEAFEVAKRDNKPIFLSIGYATCYWCHMMEKDSFEIQSVADVLNSNFVSIKVDREERPDVDQIYMDVVTGLTGHGGWPMSIFMTPDKKPFWGGTFVKQQQFISLCERLHEIWTTEPEKILESAQSITAALEAGNQKKGALGKEYNLQDSWKRGCEALLRNFDRNYGGFGPAPKFPPSQQIQSLLMYPDAPQDFHHAALTTLEHIGKRALFDHVEGGFHRYATDASWEIPHFEKMIYDNALLIQAFVEGFRVSGFQPFLQVAIKTAAYLLYQMQTPDGLFMSAEDAGDVGKEGEYYIWSPEEISELPTELRNILAETFEYSTEGNFEGNISLVGKSLADVTSQKLDPLYEKLRELRQKRERPLCDYKVITSWNGLILSALCVLYRETKSVTYLESAQKLARHFLTFREKPLNRILSKTIRTINATLEDYAYLIEGLIHLYQSDFNEDWLLLAKNLQEQQDKALWVADRGLYKSSSASDLIVERFEIVDGAMPSPNSVSLANTKFLSKAFSSHQWFTINTTLDNSLAVIAATYPSAMNRYFISKQRYEREVIAINVSKEKIDLLQLDPTIALFVHHKNTISHVDTIKEKISNNHETEFFLCEAGICHLASKSIRDLKLT
jgi:uncharacterized protein YyaL (SSP411 family)